MEKIINDAERQIWLISEFPEVGLKLIEKGEPVRVALLKFLCDNNPELLEKVLKLDFEVYNEYSSWDDEFISEANQLYLTLKRFYGKPRIEQKILSTPHLWPNFLRFVSLKHAQKIEQINKLLNEEKWDEAYQFIEYSNISLPLSDIKTRDRFLSASQHYEKYVLRNICGEKYLRNHGISFLNEEIDVI